LSVAAGGAVPQPAANHTSPIDRTASINRPASVNGAPSVDRPASVSPAAPSSDSRYQRFAVGDVDDDRMRLHRRRDGLRRLREQKRSGRCRCQRDRSHDFVHLQLPDKASRANRLAWAKGTISLHDKALCQPNP
jgi:hypothetical protein